MSKIFVLLGLSAITLTTAALPILKLSATSSHATPMIVALKSGEGQFQSAAKSTQGSVTLQTVDGKNYLRLNSNFSTENGPQVEVLLHRDEVPQVYNSTTYVSLGEIKSFQGEQWYEIPEGVDIQRYQSVSIWCREFDVTFGYAALQS